MSGFTELFSFNEDDEPESREEPKRPRWFGPPEDELGVVLPEGIVLARSGVAFDFLALARGLARSEANRIFHEQHMFEEEDLPDALLRVGFEFADGNRVSNLGGWRAHRKLMSPDAEPEGPLLMPHAGGGGNAAGGQVTMKPGYWLWPLPPSGPLRISCEWPLVDIALTTVEIDGTALVNSAEQARRLLP